MGEPSRLVVLIDGECPLCRRIARRLRALDWLHRLTFADASDDAERERIVPGLARDAALREMHVVDAAGSSAAGYDGYLRIAAVVPLLWLPGLVGRLAPLAAIGRMVYRRIAAARTRVGRCTDEVCGPDDGLFRPARRAAK